MTPHETITAAYAAFARNDPSVLFGAMAEDIDWREAEGHPLADRNPYRGAQAIGEGVFARLADAIEHFTAVPDMIVDGGSHVVAVGRYGGTMKASGQRLDCQFCHVWGFHDGKISTFQQYTDTAQWARVMPM